MVVDALQKGKVVVLPTDTVYGFSCLASSAKAVRKIRQIKKRNAKKSFLLLLKSYCQLHDFCRVSAKQDKFLRTVWPPTTRALQDSKYVFKKKPTTVILESKNKLPNILENKDGSLAVRLPKNKFLMAVLKKVNQPLVSTSLNISGKAAVNIGDIEKKFDVLPDIVVDCGVPKTKKPSRLLDARDVGKIKVLR